MLKQRVITGILLIIATVSAVVFLPLAGFALGVAAIMLMGGWEWSRLAGLESSLARCSYVGVLAILAFLIFLFSDPFALWPSLNWPHRLAWDLPLIVLLIGVVAWAYAAFMVYRYQRTAGAVQFSTLQVLIVGVCVLMPTWVALVSVRAVGYLGEPFSGVAWLLLLFVLVWGADIGAYFVGRQFGKHKLASVVSPGKTIEGVIGGVAFALVLAGVFVVITPISSTQMPWLAFVAAVTVLVSVLGDLVESMFKRSRRIKDSGDWLPGHGGIMDRIDSLTAAAPLYALGLGLVLGHAARGM